MANLSDHDLKQIDSAWLGKQPEDVLRHLAARLLEDLKAARDRLNQGPDNSSRPSGSMPPWQRDAGKSEADAGADAPAPSDAQGVSDTPTPDAGEPPADALPDAKASLAVDAGVTVGPKANRAAGRAGRRLGSPGRGCQQQLQVTRVEEYHPSCCAGWETLELVPLGASHEGALGVRIEVIKDLLMQQRCACGHTSRAQARRAEDVSSWPKVAIGEQRLLGAGLTAAVVHLCVRMRLPRRKVQELLLEWFRLHLSTALIDQAVHQAARSGEPLQDQLVQELEKAALVHADETSWMEAGQALWLWVLCCGHTVLYMIGARSKEIFNNGLSSAFTGLLMNDGYTAYLDRGLRLRCWAHLVRKLRGVAESTDAAAGRAGMQLLQVFNGLMDAIIDTCRLRNASATQLLAPAILAARTGLPAPRLPDIPAASTSTDLSFLSVRV